MSETMSDGLIEPKKEEVSMVCNRFTEYKSFENADIRAEVIRALTVAPDYLWKIPATTSDSFHNPFTRGIHGLWIHIKMAFTVYQRIAKSWAKIGFIEEEQLDHGRAAILLHDMFKKGLPEYSRSDSNTSVQDHEILVAEWLDRRTNLPDDVISACLSHMGVWYEGPAPSSNLDLLVHTCDMIASSPNITPGVYEPHEKITSKYPNIPRTNLEFD